MAMALTTCGALACQASPPPPSDRPGPRIADKRSIFADATLVPTREGERARRELALAGEATRLLESLEHTRRATVSVHRDAAGRMHFAIVLGVEGGADVGDLTERARALVRAIDSQAEITLEVVTLAVPAPTRRGDDGPLLLALTLALGAALGVFGERLAARRNAQAGNARRTRARA